MKRLGFWLLALPGFTATVPDRYIVEFSTEPVAAHVASMGKGGLRSRAASDHRALIRGEHDRIRPTLAAHHATVLESMDTVINALAVSVPDAEAAALANLPGVKRVLAERVFHLVLDHALPLHKVPDAWSMVGFGNAGAGMKIGFIDTGIDASHAGFQDASLAIPNGFPKVNAASDTAFTNNKVIVARSYASLLGARDPDLSARDRVGHGTATAMAAAGVTNAGPLATITGVAPKAWLGSYKVFGTPGYNDNASDSAILKALDDAVADGMDVINISLGSSPAPLPSNDLEVAAIGQATSLGVIVVVASGNTGPDPATVNSPGTAPSAITVGASDNDRVFAATASLSGGASYAAIPGSGPAPASSIAAPLTDVSTLDGNGMACSTLPAGSLRGAIALVLRGICTFEEKLQDAQAAGAVGALVYSNQEQPDAVAMSVGAATLPAEMVSYTDGIAIQQSLAGGTAATLDFTLRASYTSPDGLAPFSSMGPNPDGAIKPDLVAVGANMYTAAQTFDPNGELYDPSGYGVFDGTSFSTPLVAGAAALVKAARPGLTPDQYRSLLVNNAARISYAPEMPGTAAAAQQAGAGMLDVSAALRATATMSPSSLSFGVGGPDAQVSRYLFVTNIGTARETYMLSAVPAADGAAPTLSVNSVSLDPGTSAPIIVTFAASGMAGGHVEGYVGVTGMTSGVESKAPYWYAVPSSAAAYITVVDSASTLRPGALVTDAVSFHVADSSGVVMTSITPVVTAISGGGTVMGVASRNFVSPGVFGLNVRLGQTPGSNVFRITAGGISADITLVSE